MEFGVLDWGLLGNAFDEDLFKNNFREQLSYLYLN